MSNLSKELIRQIIADGGFQTPKDIGDYLKDMFKDVIQEMLEKELALELGYEKGDSLNKHTENRRNGYSKKTVKSQFGNIDLDIPRDRDSNYNPKVIPKHTRDISGLEEKIISLYARGMSTRDIHDQIKDLYGIKISAEYVSHITDVVIEYVSYKDSKELMNDFKLVYKAINEAEALSALDVVEEKWGKKYPTAIRIWRDNWDVISPFFSFPQEIRTIMYTTNIIEGVNRQFRKVTKTKSTFPSDESLLKILYLASQNIMKKWTVRYRDWDSIYNQLSIYFDNRI
ncbi:transposase [Intestinibacter bartlettii]|uniref:transposase n=1 Tax=Intestinibacter bartlettii TaxID=261299 RepID=UPI0028FE7AD7|nr:transposase [Intestinibacter bartlettii]MDU2164243.1 transposase [Intestinibacter bartlettii]